MAIKIDDAEMRPPSIYSAMIGYAESWWTTDACNLARVRFFKRRLSTHLLDSIAREYSFARGLNPEKPDCLCATLNEAVADNGWPVCLDGRVSRCIEIMEQAQARECFTTRNGVQTRQISAVTKLAWFLRPDGWTMYDSRASAGLGVRGGNTVERMRAFYGRLSKHGFEKIVQEMQEFIDSQIRHLNGLDEYDGLPATRIVDRYLTDKELADRGDKREAATELDGIARQRRYYLDTGPHDCVSLDGIAHDLEDRFRNCVDQLCA